MRKPVMVVVVPDEDYLIPLEMKLAFAIGHRVSIEFISRQEAFETYFSEHRNIDVLIIDEQVYKADLQRHGIKKTYILSENAEDNLEGKLLSKDEIEVFKYLNLNVLVGIVVPDEWKVENNDRKTRVITTLSPAGGAGCTSVALGVAGFLAGKKKRVLYINCQQLQCFQFYFSNKKTVSIEETISLKCGERLYSNSKRLFAKEQFDYLPELPTFRQNLNIPDAVYSQLIRQAAEAQEYDYLIADIGTEINFDGGNFFDETDKFLVVVNQDAYSKYKAGRLSGILNYGDRERFIFICNKYDPKEKNYFSVFEEEEGANELIISEYIERCPQLSSIMQLSSLKGVQKIGMAMF